MQNRDFSLKFIRFLSKETPRLFLLIVLLCTLSVPAMALGEALANCSPSTAKPNFRIDIHKSDKPVGIYHYNARNYNFSGIMGGLFKCRKPFLDDIYLARSDIDGKILLKKEYMSGCVVHIEISKSGESGRLWVIEKGRGYKSTIANSVCTVNKL